jgi:hypothetical protein
MPKHCACYTPDTISRGFIHVRGAPLCSSCDAARSSGTLPTRRITSVVLSQCIKWLLVSNQLVNQWMHPVGNRDQAAGQRKYVCTVTVLLHQQAHLDEVQQHHIDAGSAPARCTAPSPIHSKALRSWPHLTQSMDRLRSGRLSKIRPTGRGSPTFTATRRHPCVLVLHLDTYCMQPCMRKLA